MSAASSRLKLVGHQPNRSIGAAGSIELVRIGPCLRSRCSELGAPFPTRTVPDHPLWCGPRAGVPGGLRSRRAATRGGRRCGRRRIVGGAAHPFTQRPYRRARDVLITSWVTNFAADPAPLPIIGPPGTAEVVEATLKAFGHDIGYRIAHHADLTTPPPIEVHEYTAGPAWDRDGVTIRVAPTDHRPVTRRSDSGSNPTVLRWCSPVTPFLVTASTSWPPERMRWYTR